MSTEPVSASVSRMQRSSLKAFPVCLRPHSCLASPMPVALGAPDKSVVLSSFLVNNSVGQRAGQAWGQSKRFTDVWLAARRQIGTVSTAGKGTWWLLWRSLAERYSPSGIPVPQDQQPGGIFTQHPFFSSSPCPTSLTGNEICPSGHLKQRAMTTEEGGGMHPPMTGFLGSQILVLVA